MLIVHAVATVWTLDHCWFYLNFFSFLYMFNFFFFFSPVYSWIPWYYSYAAIQSFLFLWACIRKGMLVTVPSKSLVEYFAPPAWVILYSSLDPGILTLCALLKATWHCSWKWLICSAHACCIFVHAWGGGARGSHTTGCLKCSEQCALQYTLHGCTV